MLTKSSPSMMAALDTTIVSSYLIKKALCLSLICTLPYTNNCKSPMQLKHKYKAAQTERFEWWVGEGVGILRKMMSSGCLATVTDSKFLWNQWLCAILAHDSYFGQVTYATCTISKNMVTTLWHQEREWRISQERRYQYEPVVRAWADPGGRGGGCEGVHPSLCLERVF